MFPPTAGAQRLLVGGTLTLMISRGPSVHQTSHQLLREALGEVLRAAVRAGPGAPSGIGSVPCRAVAALFLLLRNHPVDRRGRCQSRRRRCQVRIGAGYWFTSRTRSCCCASWPASWPRAARFPPAAGSEAGRPGPLHLAGLRRVNSGSVARFQGRYYDGGWLIPGCLYEYLFDGLIGDRLLDVAKPDENGMAWVSLSDAGRTEYRRCASGSERENS